MRIRIRRLEMYAQLGESKTGLTWTSDHVLLYPKFLTPALIIRIEASVTSVDLIWSDDLYAAQISYAIRAAEMYCSLILRFLKSFVEFFV